MPDPAVAPHARGSRFAVWRLVTWLLLLLAIFGVLQYCVHAWRVAGLLGDTSWRARHADLTAILAWDIAYLVVACLTVVCAAGALLRRAWARSALRVVAGVLALWLLVTTVMLVARWSTFNDQMTALTDGPGVGAVARDMVARMHREYLVAMGLKAVSVPVLAWLCWRLGKPSVRAQFLPRRRPG